MANGMNTLKIMPDNKIRLLLVGDANSIFITNYALWLKNTKSNFETDILTLTEIKPENQVYYNRVISLSDFPSYFIHFTNSKVSDE